MREICLKSFVVNNNTSPPFTQISAICSGATLAALPTISNNGISGVWAPVLSNTATTTCTFTPANGSCATTATMTINVNTLIAENDDFSGTSINGYLGGATSTSVFINDTVNGLPAINTNVTVAISSINPPTSNISINSSGIIAVATNTLANTYYVNYSISQNGCTTTATATLIITFVSVYITCDLCSFSDSICYQTTPQTTTRSLYNEEGWHMSGVPNYVVGPRVNGIFPTAATASINISPSTPLLWWLTLNSNGTFNVAAFAPVGHYHFLVKFCTVGSVINCTPYVDVYITVGGIGLITHGSNLNHEGKTNCYPGPTLCQVNLYAGSYFCSQPLNPSLVSVTQQAPFYPVVIKIDPINGNITGESYVPTGIYTFNYQVCLLADPSICGNATSEFYVVDNLRMANPNAFKETNTFDVIVSPNPSDGLFLLSFDKVLSDNVILEVFNPVGQKVHVETTTKVKEHQLSLYDLSSGSYILKIAHKDQIISKRIIKK